MNQWYCTVAMDSDVGKYPESDKYFSECAARKFVRVLFGQTVYGQNGDKPKWRLAKTATLQ